MYFYQTLAWCVLLILSKPEPSIAVDVYDEESSFEWLDPKTKTFPLFLKDIVETPLSPKVVSGSLKRKSEMKELKIPLKVR